MQPWPERLPACVRETASRTASAIAMTPPTLPARIFSRRWSGRRPCCSRVGGAEFAGVVIVRFYGRLEQVSPSSTAGAAAVALRPAPERGRAKQPGREDDPSEHATDPAPAD